MQARKERTKEYVNKNIIKPLAGVMEPTVVPSCLSTAEVVQMTLAGQYGGKGTVGTANKAKLLNTARPLHTALAVTEVIIRHEIAKATSKDPMSTEPANIKAKVALTLFATPVSLLRGAVGTVATLDNIVLNVK